MFFQYNWMVREQWYEWCGSLSEEELLAPRTGGVGGILKTLFHIADVEWSWIQRLQNKPDFQEDFEQYKHLQQIRGLDAKFHLEVEPFVLAWHEELERNVFEDHLPDGRIITDAWGEVMRHVIAHEIHHIGQLSVWAREIDKPPVSANLIGKGLVDSLPRQNTIK